MRNRVLVFLFTFLLTGNAIGSPAESEYRGVQSSREAKIEKLRNEELRAVKMALGLRNPENRKAELYLRLAELYLEGYRADFLLEGRIHEKALARNPNAPFLRGRSQDDLRNGIGAAETILKLSVESKKLDRIYYFLGYNYSEYGDKEKSKSYYQKLSKSFPESPFTIEATRALADDFFQNGDFTEAERLYEQAIKRTNDPAQQARIYHKLAWCYYRQRRSGDAVKTMKRAIEIAKVEAGGEKLLSVREEGLRDLAVYYAELGRVDEAIEYFRENAGGNDKLVKVLEKLGKEYERTGQVEKAKRVYEVLLQTDQRSESSFRVAVKMVDLDLLKENFENAANRLRTLKIPNSTDPDTLIAIVNLKRQVKSTAVNNHERYRRKDDKKEGLKYLEGSDLFYTIYLTRFIPTDQNGKAEQNEVRMYLAEVKREKGEPGAAADLYKKVIQERDEKYAKEAAQLWLQSLASELKRRSRLGEKAKESPSLVEVDFVEASDLLERSMPNSIESSESRLRSAQILADYPSEKSNAIRRASALAKDAPNTPQGVLAARLWLQLDPTQATYLSLSRDPTLLDADSRSKGELSKDLDATAKKLRKTEISGFEKSKDFSRAGKAYEEYARNGKTEKEVENAYIGALGSYAQDGDSEQVIRVMKEWKARFPKSVALEKSVKSEATQFFIKGLFNDSAELFFGIGKLLYDRPSYLTSAALFSGGLQYKKAIRVYRQALMVSPTDEERAEIFKLLALTSIEDGDEAGILLNWKECAEMNSTFKAECLCQIGNFYQSHQDPKPAREKFEAVLAIHSGPSSRSPFIAYAQFRIAQLLENQMTSIPLEFPEDKLNLALAARAKELSPVSAAYEKAIALGGPWGIAATERMGDLSLEFAAEVEKVMGDPRASREMKEGLSAVRLQLTNRAVELSRVAYSESIKNETLSPALPVIQDRMMDAGFTGMKRSQGARSGVKLIGVDPEGGGQGRDAALKRVRDGLLRSQNDALAWIDYGNLLWGLGKPGLSRVAYERSLDLKTRYADAQNNLAVVLVSDLGLENWFAANEAVVIWKRAVRHEPKNSAALYNLGHFFNYYRLFKHSLPYLLKVSKRIKIAEVYDALSVSYWGLGKKTESDLNSKKAEELGAKSDRFTKKYREATLLKGESCLRKVEEIAGVSDLKGFERVSVNRLKQRCQL